MGNSGSMHGLSGYDEGYHYHHQHQQHHQYQQQQYQAGLQGYHQHHQHQQQQQQQQRYHDGAGTCSWMDSYKRDPPRGRSARDGGYQPDELQSGEGHWNTQLSQHQQHQQQQQQQQFKVLPDIPGKVARLRSTNNGNILHAGGTISKSKQQLQRSKSISSPTYQQHQQRADGFGEGPGSGQLDVPLSSLPPVPSRMLLLTRSRTQLSMLDDGEQTTMRQLVAQSRTAAATAAASKQQDYNHWKRFGSEPDLRVPKGQGNSSDHQGSAGGTSGAGDTRTNTSVAQSKIMKGKGKKKAPVPPAPVEKRKSGKEAISSQRIIAYSPLRKTNSDTSSTLPPAIVGDGGGNSGAGASSSSRLRLFKTRAEAKKTPAAAKLPEASDAKFATKAAGGGPKAATVESVTLVEPAHPRSFFRREKTFDIGLLTLEARKRQIQPTGAGCPATRPTLSPPLSHRKSIVKTLLEQDDGGHTATTRHSGHRSPVEPGKGKGGKPQAGHGAKGAKQPAPGGGQGTPSLVAAAQYLKAAKASNTLVIPVEPPMEREPYHERNVSSSVTPSPPPPPPPKTSVYFGMGTVPNEAPEAAPGPKQQRQRQQQQQQSDTPVLPLSTSSYFDDGKPHEREEDEEEAEVEEEPRVVGSIYQHQHHHSIESLVDSSDLDDESRKKSSKRHEPTEAEEHAAREEGAGGMGAVVVASIDEIDRTQMDIIDRFAASLLHESRRFHSTDSMASSEADLRTLSVLSPHDGDPEGQEIALCLRPTLPRKQFDIPRFSPAAAWRLLTTDDEFGRDTNGGGGAGGVGGGEGDAGEGDAGDSDDAGQLGKGAGRGHGPFLCDRGDLHALDAASEDRIERVYREPVPGLQDNKSGDSGISGDAGLLDIGRDEPKGTLGGVNEDTHHHHRCHVAGWSSNALRPTAWTPQQDLEDDDDTTTGSSIGGDGGYRHQHLQQQLQQPQEQHQKQENDARHGLGPLNEFASKGHLFSLSLPRENHLSIYTGGSIDDKVEKHVFNSLQKLHKSVSDAFKSEDDVGGAIDSNNNWFLGRLTTKPGSAAPAHAQANHEKRQLSRPSGLTPLANESGLRLRSFSPENLTATATMLNGPISDASRGKITSSISYLVSGRHMMYLPKEPTRLLIQPGTERIAKHNQNGRSGDTSTQRSAVCPPNLPGYHHQQQQQQAKLSSAKASGQSVGDRHEGRGCKVSSSGGGGSVAPDEDSRKQREDKENLQDPVPVTAATKLLLEPSFPVKLSNRRNHRFTFQSTIRQIEKRRVAEKLSREAEIKEAMRLSELEAMQRVEEEFQKKRAREKASIRHQLRLFSMEDQQDTDYGVESHHQPEEVGMPESTQQQQQLDNKRLDADVNSLPHQTGLYRKRDFSPIERQLQCYKRSNGGGTEGTMYPFLRQQDDQDEQHQDQQLGTLQRQQHQQQQVLNGDYRENGFVGEDNDNGDSGSSLGYVDTRTPYISRIIQAKSSKSFALRK